MNLPARFRKGLLVAAAYAVALIVALAIFLAYRVYVHHATFSQREFFWMGGIHKDDPDVGFALAADRSGYAVLRHGIAEPARRIPVRTDPFGFRVPLDHDGTGIVPGSVVSIGCSCTFGHGVAAESTFVWLAGSQLGLPAHNLGVCSYSAVTSIELLRKNIEMLRPAIVVYGFGNFHLQRSGVPRAGGTLFQKYLVESGDGTRVVEPRFSNRLVYEQSPKIERLYSAEKLAGRPTPFNLARFAAVFPLALLDVRRALNPRYLGLRFEAPSLSESGFAGWVVRELVAISRQAGARTVILYFPASYGEAPLPSMLDAVAAYSDADDFMFVNCAPRLFSQVSDREEYESRFQVPRDGHPNRFMHLEMATAIAEAVRSRGWH